MLSKGLFSEWVGFLLNGLVNSKILDIKTPTQHYKTFSYKYRFNVEFFEGKAIEVCFRLEVRNYFISVCRVLLMKRK